MRWILLVYVLGCVACGFEASLVTDTPPMGDARIAPDASPVPPTLMMSPATVDLGQVAVGAASAVTTLTVTNTGASPTAAIDTSLTGTAFAVLVDACAGTVIAGAGGSCTISVAFLPTADGSASATLGVASTPGGTATSTLTGTGADPANLTVNPPSSLAFGNVISGESAVVSVDVSNPAGADTTAPIFVVPPVAPFSVLVAAVGDGHDCGNALTSLAGGQTCAVRVQYAPTGTTHAAQAGTLQIIQGAQLTSLALTGTQVTPIALGPTTFAFGSVDQGSGATTDFTVTNNSVNEVAITSAVLTNATGMSITANTCAAPLAQGATCTVTVSFQPTASFTDSAKLQVNSANGFATATISAHGNAPTNVAFTAAFVAPDRFDFGSTPAGGAGASETFTLRNFGETTSGVVTPSLTNATDFAIASTTCGGALTGGATCTVTVQFKPPNNASGPRTGSLLATGASNQVDLGGQALAPGGLVLSAPDTTQPVTDFGPSVLGTPAASQTFTLKNTAGGFPQPISASFDDSEFAITGGTCGANLPSNQTCTYVVTFTPTVRGGRPGQLQITGPGNPYANVTGTGQTPATISFPPTVAGCAFSGGTCTFPTTGAGSTSSATLTLINTGDAATGTIVTTALAGTDPTQFTLANGCTTLALGATCKLTVAFKPSAGNTGTPAATFTVAASPGLASQTVTLTGTAVTPATLAISPTTPQVVAPAPAGAIDSTGTAFTITNLGGVASGNLAISIGSDTTDFKLVTGTCPVGGALAANVSCTVFVLFEPQTPTQNLTTTLTVTGAGTVTGSVTGNGLSAISASGSPIDLGAIAVGQASAASPVTFTNNADATSGVVAVQLAGPDAGAMSIVDDGCAGTRLPPHGSCTVSVRFVPTRSGAQSASLTAIAPQGSATVALSGTGQ